MNTMKVRVGVQTDAWMGITRREVHNSCSIVKQLIYRLNAATQHNDVGGDFPFITESLFEGRVEWLFSALPSAHCRPSTQFGSIMRLEVECSAGCEKRSRRSGVIEGGNRGIERFRCHLEIRSKDNLFPMWGNSKCTLPNLFVISSSPQPPRNCHSR